MREGSKLNTLEWTLLLLLGSALFVVLLVICVEVALSVAEELVREGV